MNAKRYERAAIAVTAENAESKKKYDRAEKLANEVMKILNRMTYRYSSLSDEEHIRYSVLGARFALLKAISYAAHADIVKGATNKAESRRRSDRHYRGYLIGCIHARNWHELSTSKFSEFWSNHIDEVPAIDRERMRERMEEERSRGN